jgi:hypothetical protein
MRRVLALAVAAACSGALDAPDDLGDDFGDTMAFARKLERDHEVANGSGARMQADDRKSIVDAYARGRQPVAFPTFQQLADRLDGKADGGLWIDGGVRAWEEGAH